MHVYRIRNIDNGMEYVGTTTTSVPQRWREHVRAAFQQNRPQPLYVAMRRHGVEAFHVETMKECSSYEEMLQVEIELIRDRQTLAPHGYNLVRGGRGNFGWQMPKAVKQKIAQKAIGRPAWFRGQKHSTETRAKMSAARKGKPKTEAQLAAVRKPRVIREDSRQKMRDAATRHGPIPVSQCRRFLGLTHSEEPRQKMAEARRQWWARRREQALAECPCSHLVN